MLEAVDQPLRQAEEHAPAFPGDPVVKLGRDAEHPDEDIDFTLTERIPHAARRIPGHTFESVVRPSHDAENKVRKPSFAASTRFERKKIVAGFDGETITSKAGAVLLGQLDRGLGLIRRLSACFTNRRDATLLEHTVETLVGKRVFGLALGYDDLNDHDEPRHDPVLAVLAGADAADWEEIALSQASFRREDFSSHG